MGMFAEITGDRIPPAMGRGDTAGIRTIISVLK